MKLKSVLIVIFFGLSVLAGAFLYYNSPPYTMDDYMLTVSDGEGINTVARRLKVSGSITSVRFFKALALVRAKKNIRPGRYMIPRGMTSFAIVVKLAGGRVVTATVTIPEGFNIFQISARLEEKKICSAARFLNAARNRDFLNSLNLGYASCEGYLFPDTYIFPVESNEKDVIRAMYAQMKKKLAVLKEQYRTRMDDHEILIIASLVEKEAQVKSEQRYVSSVFHNRLKLGMRLDCDPTVRYAVKRFIGPIYYNDLLSTSPYNTYRYRGMPPTPIASPGRGAIAAALNPVESHYLFFVARNDGSHYFSPTLREHNRAVAFYQRGQNNGFIDTQKLNP